MLDTLKVAKRLIDAQMPKVQAEALADVLAQALRETHAAREHLNARLTFILSMVAGAAIFAAGAALMKIFG